MAVTREPGIREAVAARESWSAPAAAAGPASAWVVASGWVEGELKDKVTVTKPSTLAAGGAAPSISSALQREIVAFRFFDILLTAGLLAGGADPLSRIMKLLRDFLDQSNKQVKDKDK